MVLLRPRSGVIEPVPVDAGSYFTDAQIERARAYRRPQLMLFGASAAIELAALAWLARRPPRRCAAVPAPAAAGAATGAALSLGLAAAQLPLGAISHRRARTVGLATQGGAAGRGTSARARALGAGFAAAGGAGAVALIGRRPATGGCRARRACSASRVAGTYLSPVVIDPIFNRFEVMPEGDTRRDVLELAGAAGLEVGEVYVGRRQSAARPRSTPMSPGWGARSASCSSTRCSTAGSPATRCASWWPTSSPTCATATCPAACVHGARHAGGALRDRAARAARRRRRRRCRGWRWRRARSARLVGAIGNRLSRAVERRADSYALQQTGGVEAFIGFETGIVLRNVADPDPPRLLQALLGTHPTTLERIGIAKAYERALSSGGRRAPARRRRGRPTRGGS